MSFKNNEILVTEQKPVFEIQKQDILAGKIKMKIDQGLNELLKRKNFNLIEEKKYRDDINLQFFEVLTKLNIYPNNLDKIESIKFFANGKLFVFLEKNEKLTFNLENSENIYSGDKQQVNLIKEKNNRKSVKLLEKSSKILDAIKSIFDNNEKSKHNGTFITKENFGEINEKDIVTDSFNLGPEFQGKNLKELQSIFNKNFDIVRKIPKEDLSENNRLELLKQEKEYLEIFMGVGDKYEGAAAYLQETFTDYGDIVDDIINLSSPKEILDYLLELHRKIDSNNYQSTTVENSYKVLINAMHQKILDNFIKKDVENKYFLRYAKIVTGRENIDDELISFDANFNNDNIDDNLRDQDKSNEAIIYIINRKGGILEKLDKSGILNIEYAEIKNSKPEDIIQNLKNVFYDKIRVGEGKMTPSQLRLGKVFEKELVKAGYEDVLHLEGVSYKDLNAGQKTKLVVLYRVSKKLEDGKDWDEKLMQGLGNIINGDFSFDIQKEYMLKEFSGLFESVAEDYAEETTKKMEEIIDDGNLEIENTNNLTDEQKKVFQEAIELFKDINGTDSFDLSDSAIEKWKGLGKFAGIIGVGMATVFLVPGVVAGATAAGFTSTLASIAFHPKGYDTFGEAIWDIGTDFTVGIITGRAGGYFSARFEGKVGTELFKKGKFLQSVKELKNLKNSDLGQTNYKFMLADMGFLGVYPEIKRQEMLKEVYADSDFLIDRKKKGTQNEYTKEAKIIHPNLGKKVETEQIDIKPLYQNEKKNYGEKQKGVDKKSIEKEIKIKEEFIKRLESMGYTKKAEKLRLEIKNLKKQLKTPSKEEKVSLGKEQKEIKIKEEFIKRLESMGYTKKAKKLRLEIEDLNK